MNIRLTLLIGILFLTLWSLPEAQACATCYGASDSHLTAGMNWGILSLAAIAYSVVLSIIAFFGFIMVRAHRMAQAQAITATETTPNRSL